MKKSLNNLHFDIRRLAALALPDVPHKTRKELATNYFVDDLDRNIAMKFKERNPKDILRCN